jgi:drug/metabolite transporter (DMT)-like permease
MNFGSQIFFKRLANSEVLSNFILSDSIVVLIELMKNIEFWIAFLLYGLSAVFWVLSLRKVPLAIAFSVLSLNYLLVMIYSGLYLNEKVTIENFLSCFFIVGGVLLIANSSKIENFKYREK